MQPEGVQKVPGTAQEMLLPMVLDVIWGDVVGMLAGRVRRVIGEVDARRLIEVRRC